MMELGRPVGMQRHGTLGSPEKAQSLRRGQVTYEASEGLFRCSCGTRPCSCGCDHMHAAMGNHEG